MSAIISNQFRILNAETFIQSITSAGSTCYTFIAQPDATNPEVGLGRSDWGTGPSPLDNFEQENRIKETVIALKKITSGDIRRLIRKEEWVSGKIYEMYRHDYSIYNLSPQTSSSSLYDSRYYIVNSNFRVYICLNNGTNSNNPTGRPSLDEPDFVDLEPRPAGLSGDGYIWKYLFTIKPSEIVKFDTIDYVPLPEPWGSPGTESSAIKNNAIDGKIESVLVSKRGDGYPASATYKDIPILGDGIGGKVTITTNSFGEVDEVFVTEGGSGYTKGIIKFEPDAPDLVITSTTGNYAQFDVIIPPKGGHGYDIYRELGAYRVLIYSRYETQFENPDVFVENDFATLGIIEDPTVLSSSSFVSGLLGLKLSPDTSVNFPVDSKITQTTGTGVTAVGYVASWDNNTKVLKYYQPVGIATQSYGYKVNKFNSTVGVGGTTLIVSENGSSSTIDTTFTGSSITINNKVYNLGSNYSSGISSSEYVKGSGNIIYIDNRQPIPRSLSQKEDIKIILEF